MTAEEEKQEEAVEMSHMETAEMTTATSNTLSVQNGSDDDDNDKKEEEATEDEEDGKKKKTVMKVAADAPWKDRMWEVFTTFWPLGFIAFGGPQVCEGNAPGEKRGICSESV